MDISGSGRCFIRLGLRDGVPLKYHLPPGGLQQPKRGVGCAQGLESGTGRQFQSKLIGLAQPAGFQGCAGQRVTISIDQQLHDRVSQNI